MTRNYIRGFARSLRRDAAAGSRRGPAHASSSIPALAWGAGAFLVMPRPARAGAGLRFAAVPALAAGPDPAR